MEQNAKESSRIKKEKNHRLIAERYKPLDYVFLAEL